VNDQGNASILVVDDDNAVRDVVVRCLQHAGYRVTAAESRRRAIELIGHIAFDVVITDMLMPDVDGIELLMYLGKKKPRPVIIAMSGGEESTSGRRMSWISW
jgi:CheY-like chemotaxis protein